MPHPVLLSEARCASDPTGLAALEAVDEAALPYIGKAYDAHCDGCLDVLVAAVVLEQLQQHIRSQTTRRLQQILR